MRTLLVAVTLLACLSAIGFTDDKKKPKEKDVDFPSGRVLVDTSLPALIPYQEEGGLLVIKAAIGDGDFAKAVLDTALPLSAMNPKLAEQQKLKPEKETEVQTLLGSAKCGELKAQQLKLGTVTLADVPFVICDMMAHLSSEKKPDAPPIWLGASAFSGMVLIIDPSRQSIAFMSPAFQLPQNASTETCELKNGRWYVNVRINDKKTVRALIDTAAVGMLLPTKLAKDLGLITPSTITVKSTLPSGKEGKVALTKLASVSVGQARANSVPAIYVVDGDTTGIDQDSAVIGTDFLLRFKVTIHFPRRKIAFEPLANQLNPNAMHMINNGPRPYAGNPPGNIPVNTTGTGAQPRRRIPGSGGP